MPNLRNHKEKQIKLTMREHLTLVRMVIIKKKKKEDKKCKDGGEKGTLVHCWQECKLVLPPWKTVWKFLKKIKIRTINKNMLQQLQFCIFTQKK